MGQSYAMRELSSIFYWPSGSAAGYNSATPMTRNQLLSFFFLGLLVFILYNILLILSPFFQSIFWAAVLAFGFYPLYEKMVRGPLRGRENAAAAVTTLVIFLTFVPLTIFIILNFAWETTKLSHWVLESIQNGEFDQAMQKFRESSFVVRIEQSNLVDWAWLKATSQNLLSRAAGAIGNFTVTHALTITKGVLSTLIAFFMTFFLVFFFIRDGARIYVFVYEITPLEGRNKQKVFHELGETFSAVLRGQLLTSFVQALLSGALFFALGIPLPFFFAALTFLISLIPIFGAASVWVPLVVYLAVHHFYAKAVILFALGLTVISTIDNIIKPWVIGKKTKLPYLLLFLGIIGGLQVYGLMGLFVAPAVLSLFFVLINIYRETFETHRD